MTHDRYISRNRNAATIRVASSDFCKAFDLIDHNILVHQLLDYDILNQNLCLIADFLGRQRIKLAKDCFSEWDCIPTSVLQGSNLGPRLFLIMINDLNVREVISGNM